MWPERTVCITIAANIANSALLTYPACFPDSVVGLIPEEAIALPEYVELFMRTAPRDLAAFASATAQANINLAILSELAVPLPPSRSSTTRAKSRELFAEATALEQRVDQTSTCLENGAQAILAKAFGGELPTNGVGSGA